MSTLAASDPQADRKWHLQFFRPGNRISDGHHHVIFLKDFCIRRVEIKIPEVLFCRFYLDDDQCRFRRRSGKIFSRDHISCRNAGKCRAMSIGITGWHNRKRILKSQCLVDIIFTE